TYHSHRSMADVAIGLMKGCAAHFNENIEVETLKIAENGNCVDFKITKK
ncbi:MAG: heme NO-binding domain-containing protein, partial [Salibacteraceae bacterium]